VYFMRSAWISSPTYNSLFWLGDQLVSWDEYDGLKNVLLGALSSALCGHAITHSDIGGYTVETNLGPNMTYIRSEELLKRWTELSTFGAGLFRTHIGSSTTLLDAQVYDNDESMQHFGQFGKIFGSLAGYRESLVLEAQNRGLPLIRPTAMRYGYDSKTWGLEEQYLFGYDFLVAPCMTEGATAVQVYIPQLSGPWVHLWSENVIYSNSQAGKWITIPAGIGFPPVLYLLSSSAGAEVQAFVNSNNYVDGYVWVYEDADAPSSGGDDDEPLWVYIVFGVMGAVAFGVILLFALYFIEKKKKKALLKSEVIYQPLNNAEDDVE